MTLKRVFFIGFVALSIIIIYRLVVSTYDLWHKQDLVKVEQAKLERNKAENKDLKSKLTQVKSKEFIETEARNKLFLVKPGESEIIVPSPSPTSNSRNEIQLPNWQKWLKLLIPTK